MWQVWKACNCARRNRILQRKILFCCIIMCTYVALLRKQSSEKYFSFVDKLFDTLASFHMAIRQSIHPILYRLSCYTRLHVFGQREEAGEPGENSAQKGLNPRPSWGPISVIVTLFMLQNSRHTIPPCCPLFSSLNQGLLLRSLFFNIHDTL